MLPRDSVDFESERNRFLIDPKEQIRVERETRARGLEVLGYYHSHPDHPAHPSNYDRDHGWPWYSYVILSVIQGNPEEMTSWVLKDDRSGFLGIEAQIGHRHGLLYFLPAFLDFPHQNAAALVRIAFPPVLADHLYGAVGNP